jgi:hypothetical protein
MWYVCATAASLASVCCPDQCLYGGLSGHGYCGKMRPQSRLAANWIPLLPILGASLAILVLIAVNYHFPSAFDELAHISAVRAQADHPDLFADTRRYLMVDPLDIGRWTASANYINHPALYYLLLSPIDASIDILRLANVALSMLAIGIVFATGLHVFRQTAERVVFAILAVAFPKTLLIGAMINNDNLAMVAAAMVFAGMCGVPGGALLIAAGLALAGWTKLTALIALSTAVGILTLIDWRKGVLRRDTFIYAGGAAVGSLPYLVSLATTGKLFHVNATVFASAPGMKPDWGFADYTREFFTAFAMKWPAAEASLPLWLAALLIIVPLLLALWGAMADDRVRRIGSAYLAATGVTLALHFGFGWQSFQEIGDLTIAQTRYYNVLWPGLALAAAAGVMRLGRLGYPALALILAPTVPGGLVLVML